MKLARRSFLTTCLGAAAGLPVRAWTNPGDTKSGESLRFRVASDGWGSAPPAEVAAVLRSAAGVLWQFFPGQRREPFVVVRGHEGPIVNYRRNVLGEIVLCLDTADRLWCQFVYQFSHEICHILCRFTDQSGKQNLWFEETLCETAALFALRRLTDRWSERPPWPHWRTYAPEFRRYAQAVMDSRTQVGDGHLGEFYRKNRLTLETTPRDRSLNGAMALPLLRLFEGSPESWEAVSWLNGRPGDGAGTFPRYLEDWHKAVPPVHRAFVAEIIRQFEAELPAAGFHSRD